MKKVIISNDAIAQNAGFIIGKKYIYNKEILECVFSEVNGGICLKTTNGFCWNMFEIGDVFMRDSENFMEFIEVDDGRQL